MKRIVLTATLLLAAVAPVLGDTVLTRDGKVRVGIIESRDERELHLRTNQDGISSVLVIPMTQVTRIILGGESGPAAATKPQPAPSAPSLLSTGAAPPGVVLVPPSAVKAPTEAELAAYGSRGFLAEMAASAAGHGLDDPARLPAAQRELWDRAFRANLSGKRAETLEAMRLLEAAMRELPEGLSRIDGIARREKGEGFGAWMGRIHWELISPNYAMGQFDLADVREVERQALIGHMKSKMGAALEPLKTYFPPVDEKTGQPTAFKPAQLSGLTISNAVEVKEQSLLAAALLLGQLKLDPKMSSLDRGFLTTQLASVNRILNRARELEPQARAAIIKAQREQQMAADKAAREAAAAARNAANRPK